MGSGPILTPLQTQQLLASPYLIMILSKHLRRAMALIKEGEVVEFPSNLLRCNLRVIKTVYMVAAEMNCFFSPEKLTPTLQCLFLQLLP